MLSSHSHKRERKKKKEKRKMIGTLTSSSAKIFLLRDGIFRFGTENSPSVCRKSFHLKYLRLDSVKSRNLKPIPLRSSSIKVSQVNIEALEIEASEISPTKTVGVRFQLRKECVFGEHFFILGDDPAFGSLWDPETALPMIWSDGHVWTLDLDLPVGRLVEFKFILKAKTGEILWQPGPNRVFKTWETNKTIRICEDWDNSDLQMMIEEEDNKSSSVNLDMPIVTEYSTHPIHTNASSNDQVFEESSPLLVEFEDNSNGALTARDANVTKEAMFYEEQGPVLVPGLIPLAELENEEVNEPSTHVSEEVIKEGKAETFPEAYKEHETRGERYDKARIKAVSLFEKSEQEEVKVVEKRRFSSAEEVTQLQRLETEPLETPHVLLERDIQWGRRMLYKLLSNLGLF